MRSVWSFLNQHWLSVVLIAGGMTAIWFVFKNKHKFFASPDNDK